MESWTPVPLWGDTLSKTLVNQAPEGLISSYWIHFAILVSPKAECWDIITTLTLGRFQQITNWSWCIKYPSSLAPQGKFLGIYFTLTEFFEKINLQLPLPFLTFLFPFQYILYLSSKQFFVWILVSRFIFLGEPKLTKLYFIFLVISSAMLLKSSFALWRGRSLLHLYPCGKVGLRWWG